VRLKTDELIVERVRVVSANIREVGFDPDTNTLEILFVDWGLYQYFAVPEAVYRGLLNAPSAGRYFHAEIRGKYKFKRL
jgi:hypothetical protein